MLLCLSQLINKELSGKLYQSKRATKDLKREFQNKLRELSSIFENIPYGILSIYDNGLIGPNYSPNVQKLFGGSDIAGKHISEVILSRSNLNKNQQESIAKILETHIGQEFSPDLNITQTLPEKISCKIDGNTIFFQCTWIPICYDRKNLNKVTLLIKEDNEKPYVPSLPVAPPTAAGGDLSNSILQDLLGQSIPVLKTFFEAQIQNFPKLNYAPGEKRDFSKIKHYFFALKGVAVSRKLSNLIPPIEKTLAVLSNDGKNTAAQLESTVNDTKDLLEDYLEVINSSNHGASSNSSAQYRYFAEQCQIILGDSDNPFKDRAPLMILDQCYRTINISLETIVERTAKDLSDYAISLGFPDPEIITSFAGDILVSEASEDSIEQSIATIFTHILKFGIESPEVREASGKAPMEEFILKPVSMEYLNLFVQDDGPGLALSLI